MRVSVQASFHHSANFSSLNYDSNKIRQDRCKSLGLLLPRDNVGFLKLREVTIISLLTRVVQAPVESAILRCDTARLYPLFIEERSHSAVLTR